MCADDGVLRTVGILVILFAAVRIIVALASGNPEHMALGTIVGIALGAIGGIALWVERHTPSNATSSSWSEWGGK
ncbi:hypothetical protein HY635_02860 [Candidatus Uhrbacteria bacterium]|nr:hypothetical protein [Candidatus Uhrbacteria bacterium]